MAVTLASVDGTWTNSPTYDAAELRRADAAMFSSAGIASGLGVSVDGSDVVTVTRGQAVISGDDAVAGTGIYRAGIGSSVTGSLEARDATNGRIDLVVFRQYDTDVVGSHSKFKSEIEIITGTPSATPGVPAKPSMAVELARITVPKSGGGAASVDSSFRIGVNDTGWVNLPKAAAMTSGTLRYRVKNGYVTVQADGAVTTPNGGSTDLNSSPIPSAYRPSLQVRAGAYLGGFAGTITMSTAGIVATTNNTGASRGSVGATFVYPVE